MRDNLHFPTPPYTKTSLLTPLHAVVLRLRWVGWQMIIVLVFMLMSSWKLTAVTFVMVPFTVRCRAWTATASSGPTRMQTFVGPIGKPRKHL